VRLLRPMLLGSCLFMSGLAVSAGPQPLVLRAEFEPRQVALGDPLRLRLLVVNCSSKKVVAVLFYENSASELLWIGDNGHRFSRPALNSMADYFPEQLKDNLATLEPGDVAGAEILSSPDPRESISFYDEVKATCYSVVATLHLRSHGLKPKDPGLPAPIETDLQAPPTRVCFGHADKTAIRRYIAMLPSKDLYVVTAAVNFLNFVREDPRVIAELPTVLGLPPGWTSRFHPMAVREIISLFVVQNSKHALPYLLEAEKNPQFSQSALAARHKLEQ
jgi:hypothetical protein